MVEMTGLEPAASSAPPLPCGARHFLGRWYTPSPMSTATLRYARRIVHRTRSQPYPKQACSQNKKAATETVTADFGRDDRT